MAGNRNPREDDDGRTIADMSQVSAPNLFLPRLRRGGEKGRPDREGEEREERPWEIAKREFSKEERRWYIFGALRAALLIALVFILGFGALIAVMALAWG